MEAQALESLTESRPLQTTLRRMRETTRSAPQSVDIESDSTMLGSGITAGELLAMSRKRCDALRNTIVTPAMARVVGRPRAHRRKRQTRCACLGPLWRVHPTLQPRHSVQS